jgi:hypothetical protein
MSIEHASYEMKGRYGFPMEAMKNNRTDVAIISLFLWQKIMNLILDI